MTTGRCLACGSFVFVDDDQVVVHREVLHASCGLYEPQLDAAERRFGA